MGFFLFRSLIDFREYNLLRFGSSFKTTRAIHLVRLNQLISNDKLNQPIRLEPPRTEKKTQSETT